MRNKYLNLGKCSRLARLQTGQEHFIGGRKASNAPGSTSLGMIPDRTKGHQVHLQTDADECSMVSWYHA